MMTEQLWEESGQDVQTHIQTANVPCRKRKSSTSSNASATSKASCKSIDSNISNAVREQANKMMTEQLGEEGDGVVQTADVPCRKRTFSTASNASAASKSMDSNISNANAAAQLQVQAASKMMTKQLGEEGDKVVQTADVSCRKRTFSTSSNASATSRAMESNDEDLTVKISRLLDSKLNPVICRLDEIAAMIERQTESLASFADRVVQGEDNIVGRAGGCGNKTNEVEQLQKQLKFFASPVHTLDTNVPKSETVWRGMLEWNDKSVSCAVTLNAKNGDPEVKFDDWPTKLVMQVLPKVLISNVGESYLKNAISLVFHPTPCPALDAITNKLTGNFAGCITLNNSSTPDCNLKVLIILYSPDKKLYLGFIPCDQLTFVKRLRSMIQQRKNDQKAGKIPVLQASPQKSSTPGSQTPSWCNNLVTEMQLMRRDNLDIIQQLKQSLVAAQRKELLYQRTPRFVVKHRRPPVSRPHTVSMPSRQQNPQPQQVRDFLSNATQTASQSTTQFDDEDDVKFFV